MREDGVARRDHDMLVKDTGLPGGVAPDDEPICLHRVREHTEAAELLQKDADAVRSPDRGAAGGREDSIRCVERSDAVTRHAHREIGIVPERRSHGGRVLA